MRPRSLFPKKIMPAGDNPGHSWVAECAGCGLAPSTPRQGSEWDHSTSGNRSSIAPRSTIVPISSRTKPGPGPAEVQAVESENARPAGGRVVRYDDHAFRSDFLAGGCNMKSIGAFLLEAHSGVEYLIGADLTATPLFRVAAFAAGPSETPRFPVRIQLSIAY